MNVPMRETVFSYTDLADHERSSGIATYGLIFIILVVLGRIQEIVPGFERLYLGKISFALALVLLFLSPVRSRVPLFSLPQMKYLFMLLALGFCSAPLGLWPKQSLHFLVYIFSVLLLMDVLLVKLIVSYRDLIKVIWGSVLAIVIIAIVAAVSTEEGRASASSTYDPNDLAFNIVCFMPVIYYLVKIEPGIRKIIALAALAVSGFTMLLTMSRSGFVGFIVIVLFILIREKMSKIKIVFSMLLILSCVLYFAPQGYKDRMETILDTNQEYNYTASGGRLSIWKKGVITMFKNPFLGTGPDTYKIADGMSHEGIGKWSTAHNSFVQIGSEFGIPGLGLFIMILVTSLREMGRLRRDLPENSTFRHLATGIEISLIGYISSGFFLSQAYSGAFFILVGLSMALESYVQDQVADSEQVPGQVFLHR